MSEKRAFYIRRKKAGNMLLLKEIFMIQSFESIFIIVVSLTATTNQHCPFFKIRTIKIFVLV
jgi:hypothetical protein